MFALYITQFYERVNIVVKKDHDIYLNSDNPIGRALQTFTLLFARSLTQTPDI